MTSEQRNGESDVPFMKSSNGEPLAVNATRLFEAVLIATVLGVGGYFMLIPELKTQFYYLKKDVSKLGDKVELISKEVNQLKIEVAIDRARRHPHPTDAKGG